MNIKFLLYLFVFIIPFSVCAQTVSDGRDMKRAITSNQFYADSTSQQMFNFAKSSSYYLNNLMPDHISKAAMSYQYDRGLYNASQNATSLQSNKIETEGTIKLGTIKLFGGFSYRKSYEDSTRFAHQTRSNTSTPYYFGSPAYVHYERNVYDFKTMANKNFFSEKLSVAAGADYKVGSHFSTNDPRGGIGEYQFNLMLSLGYQISKITKVGAAIRHGYGQERINIAYKNPRYYESSSFPMYYNHLINGYGESRPVLNERRYNDDQTRNGADIYVDITTANAGNFHLSGRYIAENQDYLFGNGSGFTTYAKYNLKATVGNLLWTKKIRNLSLSALINYISKNGEDYNIDFKANNYKYLSNNLSAKFFVTTLQEKNQFNHFIGVEQLDEERVDGIKGNDVFYKNLLLSAGSGWRRNPDDAHYFALNLTATYKMPLDDRFAVLQTNEAYFTQYVIYHDYLYNTSSFIGGNLAAEYGFPLFKVMQASFKINAGYLQKIDEKIINRTIVSAPGKDRFSSNISLNLYF